MKIGLEARNCLNFSRTWGSKADDGIRFVSACTKDTITTGNYGERKGKKRGMGETTQKIDFAEEVEIVYMV